VVVVTGGEWWHLAPFLAQSSTRVIRGCWFVLLYFAPCRPAPLPRLQAVSSRKILHINGIGGEGEYCGDNDAQLDRINVFYHEASGGKHAPRTVLFEPGMIGAVRASPLCELFRPGNLVD
jgi:hypothetical protein